VQPPELQEPGRQAKRPARTTPAQPEPAQPEPAQPETAQPTSAQPTPVQAGVSETATHFAEPATASEVSSVTPSAEQPAPADQPVVTNENPFSLPLPPRPQQPQSRAEAKAAAAERAAIRARNTAAEKAEIRAKYPIPSASPDHAAEIPAAFRTVDTPPAARKVDVPLIVSISLGAAGVLLIVYLAILVFGARG
jgi:hypothetical protein